MSVALLGFEVEFNPDPLTTLHDSQSFWDFQPWFDGGTGGASQEPSDLVKASAEPGFCVVIIRFSPQLSLAYEN